MIPDAAVEAAYSASGAGSYVNKEDVRLMLEAAAPHMLKDMRLMTLVEIAARDRPEQMEAARARVRAERRESQAEMIREAKALGFEEGFTTCAHEHMKQRKDPTHPITRVNPFGETFADRMARQSMDALNDEWRAKH